MISDRCFQLIDLQDQFGCIALMQFEVGFSDAQALFGALELFQNAPRFVVASLRQGVVGVDVKLRCFITQGVDLCLKLVFMVQRVVDALAQVSHLPLKIRRTFKTRQLGQAGQRVTQFGACQRVEFTQKIVHPHTFNLTTL